MIAPSHCVKARAAGVIWDGESTKADKHVLGARIRGTMVPMFAAASMRRAERKILGPFVVMVDIVPSSDVQCRYAQDSKSVSKKKNSTSV